MDIGIALPHYEFSFPDGGPVTLAKVVSYAQRCEALGFDSVWISDHLFLSLARYGGPDRRYATPEALAMVSAIAAATTRIRIGTLVLCMPFRVPAVLAQQVQSVHEASGGRFELGVGAGWNHEEFEDAGIAFGTPGARIRDLGRRLADLRARLGDRGPRVWVGGKGGPKIMRTVAEYADGWNVVWQMTPEGYREKVAILDQACAALGRDPGTVARSVGLSTVLGTSDADVRARYEALQRWTPGGALDAVPFEGWARGRLVGTLEACAATADTYASLGVGELILGPASVPFSLFQDEQLELAARAFGRG